MNTFPLIRVKWTNEHFMAATFGVLVLYMLPVWAENPVDIASFSAITAFSLILDSAINFVRYKKPVCAVSAAVTSSILYILTPGVPFLLKLSGCAAALLLGKHIWGGTGKNPVNPAMVGLLFVSIVEKISMAAFSPSLLLIPAMILSIPFIRFRPYAALGFITGMLAVTLLKHGLSLDLFPISGGIFFGCLVLTDPVTVTANPLAGTLGGILTGILPALFEDSYVVLTVNVLVFNLISFVIDNYLRLPDWGLYKKTVVKKAVEYKNSTYFDLTESEDRNDAVEDLRSLGRDKILERIELNEVAGLGGAAFPAAVKIKTLMKASEVEKHLIINGVECDPGLIHDHWLMERCMKEIAAGIKILEKCVDFNSVTLAVKQNTILDFPQELKVCFVSDYYPAGAEKILIKQVLGKEMPVDEIPAEKGILVLNVQTVFSIYEAVCKNKKADSKLITAADLKNGSGYVARVKLGTNFRSIANALSLYGNLFAGGGAMQCRNVCDEDVVDKNINFIAMARFPKYKESPLCSKCGACTAYCPAKINVNKIAGLVDLRELKETKKYEPWKCLQCGNCSRVCLAGRNLSARIKEAKAAKVRSRLD